MTSVTGLYHALRVATPGGLITPEFLAVLDAMQRQGNAASGDLAPISAPQAGRAAFAPVQASTATTEAFAPIGASGTKQAGFAPL